MVKALPAACRCFAWRPARATCLSPRRGADVPAEESLPAPEDSCGTGQTLDAAGWPPNGKIVVSRLASRRSQRVVAEGPRWPRLALARSALCRAEGR